jgi:hypothetical protein
MRQEPGKIGLPWRAPQPSSGAMPGQGGALPVPSGPEPHFVNSWNLTRRLVIKPPARLTPSSTSREGWDGMGSGLPKSDGVSNVYQHSTAMSTCQVTHSSWRQCRDEPQS